MPECKQMIQMRDQYIQRNIRQKLQQANPKNITPIQKASISPI
ncbi:hypothetical protein FLA_2424 [Filimonas lacunae]|nr:hypothetical protein FLA_2424 [Filimonas lacunae]